MSFQAGTLNGHSTHLPPIIYWGTASPSWPFNRSQPQVMILWFSHCIIIPKGWLICSFCFLRKHLWIFENAVLLAKKSCHLFIYFLWHWPVCGIRMRMNFFPLSTHCTQTPRSTYQLVLPEGQLTLSASFSKQKHWAQTHCYFWVVQCLWRRLYRFF